MLQGIEVEEIGEIVRHARSLNCQTSINLFNACFISEMKAVKHVEGAVNRNFINSTMLYWFEDSKITSKKGYSKYFYVIVSL